MRQVHKKFKMKDYNPNGILIGCGVKLSKKDEVKVIDATLYKS